MTAPLLPGGISEEDENEAALKKAILAYARENLVRDGDLEVDADAVVSMGDDFGAYVACWKWVSLEDIGWDTCRSCGETSEYNGDWYDGECPSCADASAEAEEEADDYEWGTIAQEKIAAIRARINGCWDHPALMAYGPLNTNVIDDIMTIIGTEPVSLREQCRPKLSDSED
jgi:hypothetical protein